MAPSLPQNSGLPLSLFAPLASPLAESYARILSDLYAESRRAAAPLRREVVLDLIIHHAVAAPVADPLPQAREALGYLESCGWLKDEIQPDHSRACVLTPHAFRLLQALRTTPPAVSDLLVAIHDLLKSALLDVDNDARLNEAARLTGQLHDLLKEIQHNVDSAPALGDTARIRASVLDAVAKLYVRGHGPARVIGEQFVLFDRILSDIAERRQRHTASIRQPSTTALELAALLRSLVQADKKTFTRVTSALFHLYRQPSSAPAAGSTEDGAAAPAAPPFVPAEWTLPALPEAEVDSAREAVYRQLNRPISPDRVRRLARALLQDKAEVRAADLVAAGRADLPLLIHLRLFGDGALGYTLEDQPWVEINGLVFRDFILKNPDYVPPPEPETTILEALAAETGLSGEEPVPEAGPAEE